MWIAGLPTLGLEGQFIAFDRNPANGLDYIIFDDFDSRSLYQIDLTTGALEATGITLDPEELNTFLPAGGGIEPCKNCGFHI